MIPGRGTDEFLHDLSLDIDECRNVLGILAWQMGQQPLEVEVHVALAGLGLQRVLIGHHELAQTVHHGWNTSGDTIQSLNNSSRRRAHTGVIFSPPRIGMPMLDAGRKRLIQQQVT